MFLLIIEPDYIRETTFGLRALCSPKLKLSPAFTMAIITAPQSLADEGADGKLPPGPQQRMHRGNGWVDQ
jgi:hypothetical protein